MEDDSADIPDDFFLHVPINPKISQVPVEPKISKVPLKVEMQILRISADSQKSIMDTLKYIHGSDFSLDDATSYKDKGSGLSNRFWMERGNLVVQGGTDFSQPNRDDNKIEIDKFRMFALLRLESYGFYKMHCAEAFDYCNGETDAALELLHSKYFPERERMFDDIDATEQEILEQRTDEKGVLESIYDTSFQEKENNSIWILTFELEYLLKHSESEKRNAVKGNSDRKNISLKPLEKCRNFLKGNCKFGNKCRFSHEEHKPKLKETCYNDHLFYLEIRFPIGNRYPFEPPLIFLKTTKPDLPELFCLRICRRLIEEAVILATDGIASVYSIAELLKNEDEINNYLLKDKKRFIDNSQLLFPLEMEMAKMNCKNLPSHYNKGSTGRNQKSLSNQDQVMKDDQNHAKKFIDKQNNQMYKDYLKHRRQLPAWAKMSDILAAIDKSQVVVISGETGCGKSTQVPQFLLDEWLLNFNTSGGHVEIVCTQPRRLSAIAVAERVSEERVERTGGVVGYQIRLESKISSQTRLTFCTTGILLRRLESDPELRSVSHIIVDEVHERSEESDFLLMILKDLLPLRPDLKVILMSATLNAKLFSDYYGDIPTIDIPGRTFPVEQLFLEDILDVSDFVLEENSQFTRKTKRSAGEYLEAELESADVLFANATPKSTIRDESLTAAQTCARYQGYSKSTCKNLYLMDHDKINNELIENVLEYIVSGNHDWPREGSILVFLPGIAEITSLHDQLRDSRVFGQREGKFVLVPLHSSLSSEDQSIVFRKAPKGKRKIVISTNIAETSLTIDDCVFVVDSGKMKEKRFDWNRNMESLDLVWVSRANALQRKGRAGRVMPGVCIHLYTSFRYKYHILSQPVPEIHRVPLEQLLLRIKVLSTFDGKDLHHVLGNTIEPPTSDNIAAAIVRLQDVGAIDEQQTLTALGHHLAALPVDVRIGKLMLFGAIFHCIDAALTIAACLSYKSPFVAPFNKKDQANAKKKDFAVGNSDQLTVLKAYQKWQDALKNSKYASQVFADENFLSYRTLTTLADIKQQLLELLVSIGFVPIDMSSRRQTGKDRVLELTGPDLNTNGTNQKFLSAILCAALYPNVVKVLTPEKSFKASAAGAVPRLPKAEELRFKTKQDGYVFIHPTSVNYSVGHFVSPYLVYQEKVKTSRIFIRDCSMVPLLPLVLFSGCSLNIELHGGEFILSLEDGWIMFQAETHKIAEMLKCIRLELVQLLEEKIKDPCLNLLNHENGNKIISTIVNIITKE